MTNAVFDSATQPVAQPTPIPLRELLPWVVFGGLLLLLALYFVGAEAGRHVAGAWHVRA